MNADLDMIEESEESIKNLSKDTLKKVVKTKINEIVLKVLKENQTKHSKVKHIEYTKFKLQDYVKDQGMTNSMVETMIALRSSMVRGSEPELCVSSSMRTRCPLQCRDTAGDTQRHLLECPELRARLSVAEDQVLELVKYDDIFGEPEDQK